MTLKELLVGFGTQVRSIWMIGLHAFAKRETRMYPEEPVYLPPRYRGRIVLTRDPDGEERCVACNLCAVACPVGCISLQKAETKDPTQRRGLRAWPRYPCPDRSSARPEKREKTG